MAIVTFNDRDDKWPLADIAVVIRHLLGVTGIGPSCLFELVP